MVIWNLFWRKVICPVNLHPLFLFWKHESVCDPEKNQVAKHRVIVIQKEKRQPGLFAFWIKMTLYFSPCFFQVHILDLIFKVPNPKKISGGPDKLEKWVQINWTIVHKTRNYIRWSHQSFALLIHEMCLKLLEIQAHLMN